MWDTVKVHKALLSKKHKQLKTYLARRSDKSKEQCMLAPHFVVLLFFFDIRLIQAWIWSDTAGHEARTTKVHIMSLKSIPASISLCLAPLIYVGPDPSNLFYVRRKYLNSFSSWIFCCCSDYHGCFVCVLLADPFTRTSELRRKLDI